MKGQARLVEMIFTSFIIISVYLMVQQLVRPPDILEIREHDELVKLAYNVLDLFASCRLFENVIVQGIVNGSNWEDHMKVMLEQTLPPNTLFSMEVYNVTVDNIKVTLTRLDTKKITNVPSFDEKIHGHIAIVTYTYVTLYEPRRGMILYITLKLARPG